MSDAALALGPPKDTEDATTDAAADDRPLPDLGTVTPKIPAPPNPFAAPSTAGLDKALDMVMGNYDANQAFGKEQDAYAKRLDTVSQDYERHLPQRQELLGRLKVPQAEPAPQMQERSPLEAIGSLGAVVGAFGSLFSRRPMTAAFKSMAAGMDALKQNDIDTFGRNYKTWKDETDLALKQADLENGIIKTVLDDDTKSWDQKLNLIKAYGGALNDKLLVQNAQAGNIRDIIGINEKKISLAERMRESVAAMTPENLIMWNYRNTFQAQNGRPPNEQEEIAELSRIKPELAKESRFRELLEKDEGWNSGDPERMRQAYQKTVLATNPVLSQFGFGQPQMVLTRDADGKPKTQLAQFQAGTGQWVTADEKRTPITAIERVLPQGSPSPDDPAIKDTAKRIANYEMPAPSGYALREPYWQAVMAQVSENNPAYDGAQFPARSKAVQAFATGKEGAAIRSFNTAIDHLGTLQELGNALNNGDVQSLNKLGNRVSEEMGYPAPTSFNAAKQIVGQEIVKAIIAGGGGVGEREEAGRSISAATSPAQLSAVIKTYKALMGGQLKSLKKQYEDTTHLKNFDDRLSDEARKELGGAGHGGSKYSVGQTIDVKGKKYRVTGGDLNGNPDIEAVK